MFSKVFAAAALAIVSAADVPVFSSNDDYDEINLNIRMLANHTTATAPVETSVSGSMGITMTTSETAESLNSNTEAKTALGTLIKNACDATR